MQRQGVQGVGLQPGQQRRLDGAGLLQQAGEAAPVALPAEQGERIVHRVEPRFDGQGIAADDAMPNLAFDQAQATGIGSLRTGSQQDRPGTDLVEAGGKLG